MRAILGLFVSKQIMAACLISGPGSYCNTDIIPLPPGDMTEIKSVPLSDWLVGVTTANGQKDIFAINSSTFDFKFLTQNSFDEDSPSFTPDGKQMTYISRGKDPLGDIAISRFSEKDPSKTEVISEIVRPLSQESAPSFNGSKLVFLSKESTDKNTSFFEVSAPNTSFLSSSKIDSPKKIFQLEENPFISQDGKVFFSSNGSISYYHNGETIRILPEDGFLRRAFEFQSSGKLRYLRYSADSNQDGTIDARDASEVIELDLGVSASKKNNEKVLLYKSNQISQFASKNNSLFFAERIQSGYAITRNMSTYLNCDLGLAKFPEQYENYISLCSEKDFSQEISEIWRFYVRNHSLKDLDKHETISQKICEKNKCRLSELSSRFSSELTALISGGYRHHGNIFLGINSTESSSVIESSVKERSLKGGSRVYSSGNRPLLPGEMVIDWALRSHKVTPERALKLLNHQIRLSPFTIKRLIELVISSSNLTKGLVELASKDESVLGYLASTELAKKLESVGKIDLALNEVVSIISRYKKSNIDVSEAVELAGKYALAAKLRGFMNEPLNLLLTSNAFDESQKNSVFRAASKTLVLQGSHALDEGQLDQARASFELALRFQPDDLRAMKELLSMGVAVKNGGSLSKLIGLTFKVEKTSQLSTRRDLLRFINDQLRNFVDRFYFEPEFHLIKGWVNYQLYLTEKIPDPSFSNWWYGRIRTIRKIIGFSDDDYLMEAKASLERAEALESASGRISERLSQNLAVVLFEIGDYKKALRYALKRIESLDSLDFSDAEVGHYFLSLASSAAGKLDEYSLAIGLASEAEKIAEKTDASSLEKIKRAKIYLYFQNGEFAAAAREITQLFTQVKMPELEMARLKVLRVWFYKLSNLVELSKSSLIGLTSSEEKSLQSSKLTSHFNLLRWLQRELAILPKDQALLFDSINNEQAKSGYFQRTLDKALGKNQAFSDRAKKSIDASQRFLGSGLTSQALSALSLSEKDIKFLAGDIDNREAAGIVGNWLDLKIVLSLRDQNSIDQLLLDLLRTAQSSCDKLENNKKNKNCQAMIGAISSRGALRSLNYSGPLTAHSARSFLWTNPEEISKYSEAESTSQRSSTDWLRLISTGATLDGLMLWSKGVLSGELIDFDLSEVDEYYDRLSQPEKNMIDYSSFRFARILRIRQKLGLDIESLRIYFSTYELSKNQIKSKIEPLPNIGNTVGIFSGEPLKPRAVLLDPFVKAQKMQRNRLIHEITDAELIRFIPVIYDLKSASISDFLARLDDYGKRLNPKDPDPTLTDMSNARAGEVDLPSIEGGLVANDTLKSSILDAGKSTNATRSAHSEFGQEVLPANPVLNKETTRNQEIARGDLSQGLISKSEVSLHRPRKSIVTGQALIVCGLTKDSRLRDFDEIYAASWDLYEGRVFIAKDCDQSEEAALPEESYFDDIDSQLGKSEFFDAWNLGLAGLKVDKVDSDLWDSFIRDLVGKGHYWGAYVAHDVKRYFYPESISASLSGMATMAFLEKKWEVARSRIDELMQIASEFVPSDSQKNAVQKVSVNSLEVIRMKAVLAENTLDPSAVALNWQELIEAAKKQGNDSMVVRGLNSLGNYYLDKAFNPAAARQCFEDSLGFAKSKNLDSFDAGFGLAMADMRANSFDKALERLYQLERALPSDANPLMKLRLNQQISSGLLGMGKLSQSLGKLSESAILIGSLPTAAQRNRYEILKLNLEAMIYGRQGWRRKANDTFSRALKLANSSNLNDLAAIVYANQGFWYRVFGDIEASLEAYKRAMSLSGKADGMAKASDLRNIGLANLAGGKLGLAEINLTEAEEISVKLGLKQNLGLSRIGLAQIYFLRSKMNEALLKADDAVRIFSDEFLTENYTRALFGRSKILEALGKKQEARVDLMRAVLINFRSYPGQRIGHSSQDLWVDLTIRDIFDDWLERYGAENPSLSLGLMAFWQRRQTVDRLLTVGSPQSKLLDSLSSFSGDFLETPHFLNLPEKEIEGFLLDLSEKNRQKIPRDVLLLWSLKHSVLSMHFSHDKPQWKALPIDRKNFLRYSDFSERLLEFMGDTQLFSSLWYAELLKPIFGDSPPPSIAFLTSDEFDDFPLEVLSSASSRPLATESNVRRLMGGFQAADKKQSSDMDSKLSIENSQSATKKPKYVGKIDSPDSSPSKVSGFIGGSKFVDLDGLPLIAEEAKVFEKLFKGRIYLNTDLPKKDFNFLQISGHFYLQDGETPKLALGPKINLDPSEILEKLPSTRSLFLNTCGVRNGSHLMRAIASLRGARQIIDANGKLPEISSFTMAKELLPLVASGQELSRALQDSRAIISQQGKHPSYWARFRYWDIF